MPTRQSPTSPAQPRITKHEAPRGEAHPLMKNPSPATRQRVVIENIHPCIDGGRFAIKRIVGEEITVEADIFADGHDLVAAVLQWRGASTGDAAAVPWHETPMTPIPWGNDRWRAAFTADHVGFHEYRIAAWIDRFGSWQRDTQKKLDAGQQISVDLLAGAELVESAAASAANDPAAQRELESLARAMRTASASDIRDLEILGSAAHDLVSRCAERRFSTESRPLRLWVDRERARFSTWYEMFPRSASDEPGRHGTFRDVEKRLPYIAHMGFDILYLPPIHPIGRAFRKGRNNRLSPEPDDPGSPWAIGCIGEAAPGSGDDGGHKSIHRHLGTMQDFERLVAESHNHGIEIALDLAFQCSPDHPYVRHHPEWFRRRPDGTIQYAENPPKKYQDIYPFDFETDAADSLWHELKSIVEFWINHGVKVFRVDNPHTKAFAFWEWLIVAVQRRHPDTIFLSEAFTRPKVMYRLAKLGFTQSYTYFAWKNEPWEIEQYWRELTQTDVIEYFRPCAWPNTPDILNEYLQRDNRGAYMARLVLAATLCASYGIYGPPFEQMVWMPREPGSEEYLDSEKYQVRHWHLDRPGTLVEFIARINRIRRGSPALQQDRTLRFHRVDNPALLCYSKSAPRSPGATGSDGASGRVHGDSRDDDVILCIVNTDPNTQHWGTVDLDMQALGLDSDQKFLVHDLLTEARYLWHGPRNYVGLDPAAVPAHILRVHRHVRTEHDFDSYM